MSLVTVLSLTWEPPYLGKTVFILRRDPAGSLRCQVISSHGTDYIHRIKSSFHYHAISWAATTLTAIKAGPSFLWGIISTNCVISMLVMKEIANIFLFFSKQFTPCPDNFESNVFTPQEVVPKFKGDALSKQEVVLLLWRWCSGGRKWCKTATQS